MKGGVERECEFGSLTKERSFSPRWKRRGDTRKPVAWNAWWRKEKTNGKDTWRHLKEKTAETVSRRRRWKKLKVKKLRRRRKRCLSSEERTERQMGVSQSNRIMPGS